MGTLYIVATPIGNLSDMTFRAVDALKTVDYVLCEDTRVTGKLLSHFGIDKRMVSFNEFNEESRHAQVLLDLTSGSMVALVSDAGTPLVSDPGYKLVRDAIASGFNVETVPGASSVISALVVSGLPPDKFCFYGYMPKKDGKRNEMLEKIKGQREILKTSAILFESPYRVLKTLRGVLTVFGDINVVVVRELTKMHEETIRDKASSVIAHFEKQTPKGEFVILF